MQGGLYAVGTHSVTCFASDLTGNTGSTTVEIRVKGAGEQMAELQADAERIRAVAGC